MSKKAKGITMCHYAPFTIAQDGTVTYKNPIRIPDLENLTVTDTFAEGKNYADNIQNIYEKVVIGATIGLEFSSVSREIESDLTGHKYKNGQMEVGTEDVQKGVALLYQKNYSDGSFDNIIYYSCKLTRDSDGGQTQGESIAYQTTALSGEAMPLPNGKIKFVIASDELPADISNGDGKKVKDKLDNFFKKVQFIDKDHTL